MDLLKETKEICARHRIKPARSKGQNFLVRTTVYDEIIEAAELDKNQNVLEVGPGLGFLTKKLAENAKQVVTVELDDILAHILGIELSSKKIENIKIINQNVLDFIPGDEEMLNGRYKIVANLPYNITSVFLRKFLNAGHKPEMIVLMLQKEVVERMVAKPGKMSLLAISVQFYAEVSLVTYVPAEDFYPAPKVGSAVVKIVLKKNVAEVDEKKFFRLVKFGFIAKRKMLKNNLSASFNLPQDDISKLLAEAGFSEKVRAQELGVDDWLKLLPVFDFVNK